MRIVDVLVHNKLVDLVPTYMYCCEHLDVELMYPTMFMHCLVCCMHDML